MTLPHTHWNAAILAGCLAVLTPGCATDSARDSTPTTTTTTAGPDFLLANIDPAVSPADDFFQYANGTWLRQKPIPPSESGWGIGNAVREELYAKLRHINEQAAAHTNARKGTDPQKLGDFWRTALDEDLAERMNLRPLQPELDRIAVITTVDQALDVAFALLPLGVDVFLRFAVSQDEKRSDAMSVHLAQGGLGLPERDFYFNPEAGVATIRREYASHLARTLQLLGEDQTTAGQAADQILALETAFDFVKQEAHIS